MDSNVLVIDIETVSGKSSFEELSPEMQALWAKKAGQLKNPDELTPQELFSDKGAIYAEFGKIVTIAFGIYYMHEEHGLSLRVKAIADDNEGVLLDEFKSLIESKFDQSKLAFCAHNGREFDYPYLGRRMLVNGISLPYALQLHGKKPWEVNHIDTMEMWKFGDWKSYTSLELLTTLFGIPSSKDDIDGSMVNEVYYRENGLSRIARYCCNDVIATAQLYLKLSGKDLIPEENIQVLE
jgi:predicted PolB exonuclease-like 3'-5' exonuclease